MSHKASFTSARLFVPLLALPRKFLSSSTIVSVIQASLFHCLHFHGSFSSLSLLECECCLLGKHTRVLFPKRLDPQTKSPFELVYTDVWGLSRSTSTLGFRYFVTFIDDYSRCTWLFLMKTRVELFSIFKKFHAEICTQFNTSIRILRSDNAKEYFCTPLSSFMSSHGILHQSFCAYTPQQNGVAERKNLHLVETARILLPHHKVP